MKKVYLFTDGGCHGNPGPGGWAAILRYGSHTCEISGGENETTNNRMELCAAIEGLKKLTKACEVVVYTDSQYLRKGITEWIHSWKQRGWKTVNRTPVKNADLWQALDEQVCGHKVQWQWIKGHAGHSENERCDILATAAIEAIKSGFS